MPIALSIVLNFPLCANITFTTSFLVLELWYTVNTSYSETTGSENYFRLSKPVIV